MKDKLEVALFAFVFVFLGIRLYQKYVKKDTGKPGGSGKSKSSFGSASKNDDYEPYSKK
jgi:hypothetical protein